MNQRKDQVTKADKKRKRTINTTDLEAEVAENNEEKLKKKYKNSTKRIKKRN